MTHVLIVERDLALADRLSAALAPERITVVATAKEAVEVIASGTVQIGVASSALFQDKLTLLDLRLIPWIILTDGVDDELAVHHNCPELNAQFLSKDDTQRFLELLPLRIRLVTSRERVVLTIADQFPGMVAYWDSDERCQFANVAYKHWFGRGPRELLEVTLRDLLGPIYPLNEPYIRGALRGEPQRFERSLPDPRGGPPRHTLATYTPDILDGHVRGFVAIVTDITEEYILRQALVEREHRWATLFNILPVGVTVVDAQGAIVEKNPAIEAFLRLERNELEPGQNKKRRYIHTDGRPFTPGEFPSAKALATRLAVGPIEIGVIEEDHPTIWTSVSAAPFPNEDKVVIVTRDTTNEKTNAARFEAIVDASPIPYAINDERGNITYVNPAFINAFGYTSEDIPTLTHWWPLAYPDPTYRKWVITEWTTRYAKSKRENTPVEPMELTIRTKNGCERDAVVGTVTLEGTLAGEHLIVLVDITEHKKAERQLEESRRLASLGALAGGIAHDFNNLLTPILAHVDLALAELSSTSSLHRGLSEIQTAARRAAALVRQILAVSRPGDESKTRVDVGPLVEEVVRLLRASLPSNISIQVQIEPNSLAIFANSTRIHQVILNLATNAREAMVLSGGTLTIAVAGVDEKWIKVSVIDTGVGIEPDVLSRVFEPYFTTKFSAGGTGLGLATVRAIVTSLGGSVAINSERGKGTTVDALFPALSGKFAMRRVTPPPVQPLPPLTGQGQHILVVDDEPLVARAAARMLTRIGYRTTVVYNAADAIAAYEADTSIAAVITDFTMPGMNGLDLARTLFELRPTRVIITTGLAENLTDENMKRANVQRILLKPYGMAALGEAIAAVLADKH